MSLTKKLVCIFLCIATVLTFSSCSKKVEITEENINEAVKTVETALKEFDTKTLKKYVESETLSYIIKFAENKEQFADLGKAIFSNLTLEVDSVDTEKGTVTVKVSNNDLYSTASMFVFNLTNLYSTSEILSLLNSDSFLDKNLKELSEKIAKQPLAVQKTITLTVTQGKRNLVLSFDEDAEDAVSGGALNAIKSFTGKFSFGK